jgi:hypothetical protein
VQGVARNTIMGARMGKAQIIVFTRSINHINEIYN